MLVRPAVQRKLQEDVATRMRVIMSGAAGLALLGLCCVASLGTQPSRSALLDPDAPHARSNVNNMYVPQLDPDSPHPAITGGAGGRLKLEHSMQSVLASMAKGASRQSPQARQLAVDRMYNPTADPDAPNGSEELKLSPFAQKMRARLSVEAKMDKELKLKAQVAELSPKYMPKQNSMMLDLKASKPGKISFKSQADDNASKDDRSISKQLASANTKAESSKEEHALAEEKAKAALLAKKRREEVSWIKHNWAVNGPPKRPGFGEIQKLVAKDMKAGAGEKKIMADEQAVMDKYHRLERSYSAWRKRHDTYGTE